jgi:hypothetical protein
MPAKGGIAPEEALLLSFLELVVRKEQRTHQGVKSTTYGMGFDRLDIPERNSCFAYPKGLLLEKKGKEKDQQFRWSYSSKSLK